MSSQRAFSALIAGILLSACGKTGGGLVGADGGHCVPLTEATVTTVKSSGCATCTIANEPRSVDAKLATSAMIKVDARGEWAALRATAKPGTEFKAGQMPGAFLSLTAASATPNSVAVETFLAGTLQENFKSDNFAWHESGFFGFMISKPFDAVEIAVTSTQGSGAPEVAVAEFCSDYLDSRGRRFN